MNDKTPSSLRSFFLRWVLPVTAVCVLVGGFGFWVHAGALVLIPSTVELTTIAVWLLIIPGHFDSTEEDTTP